MGGHWRAHFSVGGRAPHPAPRRIAPAAKRNVAGGILFLSCLSVCPWVRRIIRDGDECITVWVQLRKVKVQGQGGITYAGTVAAQAEPYSNRRLVSS